MTEGMTEGMTEIDELSHLIAVLRGQQLAIGVDDVARIAAVLHHTRAWPRERRVRALRTLLGRSSAERERFDHIAPLLLVPRAGTGAVPEPRPEAHGEGTTEVGDTPGSPRPPGPPGASVDLRPRWPLAAGGVIFAAAIALALHAVWPTGGSPSVDAGDGTDPASQDAGLGSRVTQRPAGGTRRHMVSEPSSLPGTFRGIAEASGVASLVLLGWSLLALRPRHRRAAAIERLARSPGRRTVRLAVDPSAIHPIDRATIATLAHMLAAPEAIDRNTTLDPGETIEQTARHAGRLTLCFARESEQPRLILLEDVARSMERWPAHATQLARALEAQGQPVERRYIAGDPLQISERRAVDGRAARFEEATTGARVVIVSDGAYFDREAARTSRHARALEGTIWLQPRPAELWRAGARWLGTCAFARTLGAVPSSLVLPAAVPAEWRPPRPGVDVDETADAWRSALGADAYLAFAATALLDLAASWSAALVWALISDGVIAPPWRQFERIWDLPELAILPGGRIGLAPELRDRLLADARGERPERVQRVAAWIDDRMAAAIEAAGEGSLGAAVGEVYRDRVARAAGLDGAGARVRQLAERGLSSVIAAQVSGDERDAWRVRDPQAAWPARLRGPLLGLALLATAGFGIASAVAPAQHDVSRPVPDDAGVADAPSDGAVDAPVDAYEGDPGRGERVAQRTGCLGCHADRGQVRRGLAPPFAGMWGATVMLANDKTKRPVRRIVDERYVRDKLLYPRETLHLGYPPVHVSYADTLDEHDTVDLIAYLQSLATRPPPPPPPPPGGDMCGNSMVEPGEQCDDGNTIDGDGCSSKCTAEVKARPVVIQPSELEPLRVSGETNVSPSKHLRATMLRDGVSLLESTLRLCIDTTGAVTEVVVTQATGYDEYDKELVAAVRAWRYRPYVINGAPVPACSTAEFQYRMAGAPEQQTQQPPQHNGPNNHGEAQDEGRKAGSGDKAQRKDRKPDLKDAKHRSSPVPVRHRLPTSGRRRGENQD